MRNRVLVGVLVLVCGALVVGLSLAGGSGGGHVNDPSFVEVSNEVGFTYETAGKSTGSDDGAVFVTDYDNDGWQDVLAIGGETPVLFENANGTFTESGALPKLPYGGETVLKSALVFDHDNDGWEEIVFVPANGPLVFLENDGGELLIANAGLPDHIEWATGAEAADFDGDGCLDLYVIQSGDWTSTVPNRSKRGATDPGERDNGRHNLMFRGTCGKNGFERVNGSATEARHWSLATSAVDFTGDGRPDIHVANDFYHDMLYVNQGNGTFDSRPLPDTNRHGMASDVGDVNGDGRPDIFVDDVLEN